MFLTVNVFFGVKVAHKTIFAAIFSGGFCRVGVCVVSIILFQRIFQVPRSYVRISIVKLHIKIHKMRSGSN